MVTGEQDFLKQDLLFPFRAYISVNEFAGRVPAASLAITLTGFLLSSANLSPGVAGAVGILGLSITFVEVLLRILFNSDDPLGAMNVRRRASAFLIYLAVGFAVFLFFGPGSLSALDVSLIQFIAGIVITYLAGVIFMRTYSNFEQAGAGTSLKISSAMFASIGSMTILFFGTPIMLELLGQENLLQVFRESPRKLANTSMVSFDMGKG